jgi:hypothetical protein
MMNTLAATSFVAQIIYSIFVDSRYAWIYLTCLLIYTVITQIILKPFKDNPKRVGMRISSWDHPTDPSAYLLKEFNVEKAKEYVKKLNSTGRGPHITFNHLITKGIGWAIYKRRREIGRIAFGYFKPAKDMGITILCDS